MKLLILMSAWVQDESENSKLWADYYRDALREEFAGDDKIIAINCGTPSAMAHFFANLPNTLSFSYASEHLHIGSDSSGFQTCLKQAIGVLDCYDVVLFLHTKGASYRWIDHEPLRRQITCSVFDRSKLLMPFATPGSCLAAIRGHLPQTLRTCDETVRAARLLRLDPHHFSLAATYTLYAVDAPRLKAVLLKNGESLVGSNLADLGFNRFFFEGPFASVLTHGVERLEFLLGAQPSENVNRSVCVDAYPQHSSFVTRREFDAFVANREGYQQRPIPYIFGPPEAIEQIRIQYEP